MELKNGYKVLFATAKDGERTYLASTTGLVEGADEIAKIAIGTYKLVYEKDGKIYGSAKNVPTESDTCLTAFDKIFVESDPNAVAPAAVEPEEEVPAAPVKDEEPVVVEEDDNGADGDETGDDE